MNALEQFMIYFETKSKYNKLFSKLAGHVIVGQLTKHIKLPQENYYDDNRVHLFLIQRSGTGKSAGNDAFLNVVRVLGQSVHSMDDFSDASVAGTVVDNDDDNDTTERAGFLGANDYVYADEASTLFDPTKHQAKTLIFIQKACNPIGSPGNIINRSLSAGAVETTSETSFLLTTFPPERRKEVEAILNSGLMQRMLFFPRPLDTATKRAMSSEVIKQQSKEGTDEQVHTGQLDGDDDDVIYIEKVVNSFLELRDFASTITEVKFPAKFESYLLIKSEFMYDYINFNTQRDDIREKIQDFVIRWIIMIRKLATHHAILERRSTLVKRDLEYGWNIIRQLMIATHQYIEKIMTMESEFSKGAKLTNHDIFYEAWTQLKSNKYDGVPEGYISKKDLLQRATLISGFGGGWFNKTRAELEDRKFIKTANIRTRERYYMVLPREDANEVYASEEPTKASNESPRRQRKRKQRNGIQQHRKRRNNK